MTETERDERLLQGIIETPAGERIRMKCGAADLRSVITDLLSLLNSKAAHRPVGWQSAQQRADPRVVTVTFENRECAEAFISGIEPAIGPIVAATAMRDACVDAIKSLRATPHGAAYSNAINDAIHKVESLTLDQVEQEKQYGRQSATN